ncbi:short chain dehydrogenase/reductase [Cutaneotrichosporon oleaginosum]|uniref:Short chain dehydrogenase/reductase n=1 Tax=Cutaneotrichosporon oleaginosum TaxID=879819 RepID=A0A0J0XZF4_9TREE|nr:short chain dehydrogenase/reductase [Cutaneotrichosporon oleaginosum]KLT46407.1 short chain dehydrogenase/reductase [Cutaneotrichosporon oleaginosum]TXT15223.1 hypothetical protein COLE_01416 [Cutaneotrichosporon oleaginosum]
MVNLQGKRALITGGTRGVGALVANLLAQRGVRLALNYASNKERAEGTLKELAGDGHAIVKGDAFTREGIAEIVKGAKEALGGIDIVVSNAGWTAFSPNFNDINAISDADWLQCYNANVMSHLWLMQAVQDELKANHGSFVVSASAAGLKPSGSSMAYSVSKAATIHLTKSLAMASAPEVRVNAVAAGLMLTEWSQGFTEEKLKKVRERNVLKKITDVEDVALQYVSLIENGSMTGQVIQVNSSM